MTAIEPTPERRSLSRGSDRQLFDSLQSPDRSLGAFRAVEQLSTPVEHIRVPRATVAALTFELGQDRILARTEESRILFRGVSGGPECSLSVKGDPVVALEILIEKSQQMIVLSLIHI